jgi:hypothetical protein
MSEEKVKRQTRRARITAIDDCREEYGIVPPDCIVAVDHTHFKIIRVVVGRVSESDILGLRELVVPDNCLRQIWHRNESGKFEKRKIE